jgi:hypothetical protein
MNSIVAFWSGANQTLDLLKSHLRCPWLNFLILSHIIIDCFCILVAGSSNISIMGAGCVMQSTWNIATPFAQLSVSGMNRCPSKPSTSTSSMAMKNLVDVKLHSNVSRSLVLGLWEWPSLPQKGYRYEVHTMVQCLGLKVPEWKSQGFPSLISLDYLNLPRYP